MPERPAHHDRDLGHLQPDYLRSQIDRLRFGTPLVNDLSNELQPSAANR